MKESMKKILLLGIVALMGLGITSCGTAQATIAEESNTQQTVYICTGGSSTRYHATSKCRGLSRCGGKIIGVSKATAEDMGRTPCQICY